MSIEESPTISSATQAATPVNQCYTCAHWEGDKEKVHSQIEAYPMCMDLFKGWPESGSCGQAYHWADLTVRGDATATLEVNANFGCPYWEA